MIPAACLFAGFLLGAFGVWWVQREEIAYLRREKAIADDRLLHAWRDDKAVIPPRPVDTKPPEALPIELQECVSEWESPEARAAEESHLRELYFTRGWGVKAILKDRENNHP